MTIMKKNYTGSFRFQTTGIIQLLTTERNCVAPGAAGAADAAAMPAGKLDGRAPVYP